MKVANRLLTLGFPAGGDQTPFSTSLYDAHPHPVRRGGLAFANQAPKVSHATGSAPASNVGRRTQEGIRCESGAVPQRYAGTKAVNGTGVIPGKRRSVGPRPIGRLAGEPEYLPVAPAHPIRLTEGARGQARRGKPDGRGRRFGDVAHARLPSAIPRRAVRGRPRSFLTRIEEITP